MVLCLFRICSWRRWGRCQTKESCQPCRPGVRGGRRVPKVPSALEGTARRLPWWCSLDSAMGRVRGGGAHRPLHHPIAPPHRPPVRAEAEAASRRDRRPRHARRRRAASGGPAVGARAAAPGRAGVHGSGSERQCERAPKNALPSAVRVRRSSPWVQALGFMPLGPSPWVAIAGVPGRRPPAATHPAGPGCVALLRSLAGSRLTWNLQELKG